MSDSKRKKKNGNVLSAAVLIVGCFGVGCLLGTVWASALPEESGLPKRIDFLIQALLLVIAFFLQIILHEGGHLIAGLMTGYRFSSFRIGNRMLLKNQEGFSFRKFSLAGTAGQCLLIPPEKSADGTYPYRLYHLGGVLMNLMTAVLFFAVFCLISAESTFRPFFLYLAFSGLIVAVTNGLPVRMNGIATDGYNVIHIGKEPFALEAMWLQLKINEAQTNGIRLKDLPEEWFRIPENAAKDNEIISCIAAFAENRAMDELDFRKAKELISKMEDGGEYEILGLYKNLLLFDKITIDLIENGANADISALNSKQLTAFRKTMSRFPSVIRTEYAIRLLKEKDLAGAEKIRDIFRRVALKYPMKADIDSETEIMDYMDSLV